MAGFSRVGGPDLTYERGVISSITVAVGDVLAKDRSSEVLILATSSSSREDIAGVAVESKTTSDTSVLYEPVDPRTRYQWDTTNETSESHNFHRQALTDEDAVNNDTNDNTADTAVVEQRGTIGAASDKKAWGYFIDFMDRA